MLPHGVGHSIFQNSSEHLRAFKKALTKEVKLRVMPYDELEAELDQSIVDRKHDEIERKKLLYVASNYELNVSRFTEMQKAHLFVKAHVWNLKQSFQFTSLYHNVCFRIKSVSSVNDTPDFTRFVDVGQMKASLQGKDNNKNELFRAEMHDYAALQAKYNSGLNKIVRFIRSDNGIEFVNKTLYDYYESIGIFHQKTVPRNSIAEDGCRKTESEILVEAARTNANTSQRLPIPGPAPSLLTPGPYKAGLVTHPATCYTYDPIPNEVQDLVIPTGPSVSISIDLDAPSGSHMSSPLDHHSSSALKGNIEAVKRVFPHISKGLSIGSLYAEKDTAMALTAIRRTDHAGCQRPLAEVQSGMLLVPWSKHIGHPTSFHLEQVEKGVVELLFVKGPSINGGYISLRRCPEKRSNSFSKALTMKCMKPETTQESSRLIRP
ncbi:retrovirus-related pol polyprotein from transposon TNT 1-94 [Tanacetum coccineum]